MRISRRIGALAVLAALAVIGCAGGYGKPSNPQSQLAFGVEMAKRGLWNEALFRFRQAERLDPGNARIINNLAVAYEATGKYEEALEHYRRALRAAPGSADLKNNYARFSEFYASFNSDDDGADDGAGEGSESSPGDG